MDERPVVAEPWPFQTYLSRSESRVLVELCNGRTNTEIGDRLFCSTETVKTHLKAINRALGTRTRTEAIVWAHRSGELPEHAPGTRLGQV